MNIIEWRNFLCLDESISSRAKHIGLTLSLFYRQGKRTYPTIDTICEWTSLAPNTVSGALKDLQKGGFIDIKSYKLPNARFRGNEYVFCGLLSCCNIIEKDSPSANFAPTGEVANEAAIAAAIEPSKFAYKIEEIEEIEEKKKEREPLSIFKNKILNEEMRKFAEDKGVFGKQLETSWQRFLIKKGGAMIERNCSYEQFFADWQLWILNEKVTVSAENAPTDEDAPLVGEDLKIQHLGSAAWRRKKDMTLNPDQKRLLDSYEAENGDVWWTSLREFNQGKKGK